MPDDAWLVQVRILDSAPFPVAQLLTRQPHDRALLSTQTGSRKARGFYAKNGWMELASVDFGPGYPPYLVLGKRL